MGDKAGNPLEVGEKAVSLTLAIVKRRRLFKVGCRQDKLVSPWYVPARGIHSGNTVFAERVKDPEEAMQNSGGNIRGKIGWNR